MSSRRFVLFLYICIIASMFFACSPAKPMETAPTNSNIPAKLDENQNSIGLKLVTPVDSSGVGAGNEIGYYDLLYRGMGANILYTDYATKQCVYLSSQVSSTHQDETDLSWIPSVDGGIEPFLSGDKLYMRVIGMPGDSDGSGTPGKIMEMNLDGSERRDLFTLQSGETFTQNAIGNPVPANAHVENNTFIVELDYTSVTYPVTYGIQLYSDTEFKKYFYSGGWESYVAPWNYTLALTPREWRTEFLDETAKALRWSAVYNSSFRQETHYWVNETGIYNQFYCHVNIAGLKPTWHLEPLRPDYGYGYTLSMGCNPE